MEWNSNNKQQTSILLAGVEIFFKRHQESYVIAFTANYLIGFAEAALFCMNTQALAQSLIASKASEFPCVDRVTINGTEWKKNGVIQTIPHANGPDKG